MKLKQLLAAALLLCTAGASAQTDVTSTYIKNAGFDTEGDFQTGNIGSAAATDAKAITDWTAEGSTSWTYGGCIAFGGSGQINGASIPTTNSNGEATGGALVVSGAWDGGSGYIDFFQEITLPAGNYTLEMPVNNVGKNENFRLSYFGFTTTDNTYAGTITSFPVNTWTTNTITFSLAKETSGKRTIGFGWPDTGSGNTPKLVVDYVKALYKNYTETLQSTIDRATILNARASDSDLASAITTAQGVLTNADNTVAYQATIDEAVSTLRAAISTAAAKIVLLEGENITFMFENADFESSTPITGGITTYDYDAAKNGTSFSRMQVVEGWTIAENGNAKSAGVYEFGTTSFLGSKGDSYKAPTTASSTGETKALGIVAVWQASAQYKQAVTFPAGSYIIEVPVYNTAGTTAFAKNLIGFVENDGTEHLATAKTYATGSWITEKVIFELENETAGYLSLGYTATNSGSAAMPHLFIDNVKVTYTSPIAAAYQKYQDALTAANEAIANEDYANVTGSEKTALQNAIDATPEATKDAYIAAAEALDAARENFVAAKANYDAFAAAKETVVPDLAYSTAEKKTALEEAIAATATTSDDAAEKAAAITTALRAYFESHALAEGVEGAVDMTDKVAAANADTNTGWTNGIGTNQGQGYTDAAGTMAAKYLDGGWASNTGANIDMTRSVEIPAGKYLLTVTARGAVDLDTYTLSIGGQTIDLPHANGASGGVFGNGWDDASVEFEADGSVQTLEVIATSTATQQWMSINRFRLVRLELYTEMATAEDYAALNAAITEAEGKALGFDEGEYAPYKNIEALQAIANAKAINQEVENAKADIEALTTALGNWTANTEEVDAIFDGQFATTTANTTSGDINLPGWTKVQGIRLLVKDESVDPGLAYTDGKAAVFSWGGTTLTYGEQTGYTLPLNKGELYEVTLKVAGWRDGDFANVLTVTLDGDSKTVNPNVPGKINDAEGNPFASVKFYLTPTADNSTLTIYANHHFAIADLSMKLATAEELNLDEAATFEQTEDQLANVTVKRNIVEGLNAVSLPFALDADQVQTMFGEGAVVYTYEDVADGTNSQINFNTKAEQTIEANVPVLVKATAASTSQSVDGVIVKTAEAKVAGTNFDFVGTYAPMKVAAKDYFVSGGKLYKSAGNTNLKAFRAYVKNLNPESEGEVKLFIEGEDGIVTAIDTIDGESVVNGAIFNLAGQRVEKAQKGVYIIGGKKVAVK